MNTALWVIQALLAAFFFITGFGKVSSSKQKHIDNGHIKPGSPVALLRVLGALELLGSIGIIIPWLTGIASIITPITAVCFCLVMVGALMIHTQKKEYKFLPMPLIIIVLAAVVAYYRLKSATP